MAWFSYSWYNNYIILISRTILFAGIGILLARNLLYLNNRAIIIQPLKYVFKHENKNAFLRRNLEHYAAVEYINNHLSKDAKIFTMFLGRRGYYLERDYKNDPSFGRSTLSGMITSAKTKGILQFSSLFASKNNDYKIKSDFLKILAMIYRPFAKARFERNIYQFPIERIMVRALAKIIV